MLCILQEEYNEETNKTKDYRREGSILLVPLAER